MQFRAYMDNITTLTTTVPCTRRLLRKLEENINWAHMKIKPCKSQSISIVKGVLSDLKFFIGDDQIPTVSEQQTRLPGKLKVWCLQFGLLPQMLWTLARDCKMLADVGRQLGFPKEIATTT